MKSTKIDNSLLEKIVDLMAAYQLKILKIFETLKIDKNKYIIEEDINDIYKNFSLKKYTI